MASLKDENSLEAKFSFSNLSDFANSINIRTPERVTWATSRALVQTPVLGQVSAAVEGVATKLR